MNALLLDRWRQGEAPISCCRFFSARIFLARSAGSLTGSRLIALTTSPAWTCLSAAAESGSTPVMTTPPATLFLMANFCRKSSVEARKFHSQRLFDRAGDRLLTRLAVLGLRREACLSLSSRGRA